MQVCRFEEDSFAITIDDYAKDGGLGEVVVKVFTMSLCALELK